MVRREGRSNTEEFRIGRPVGEGEDAKDLGNERRGRGRYREEAADGFA